MGRPWPAIRAPSTRWSGSCPLKLVARRTCLEESAVGFLQVNDAVHVIELAFVLDQAVAKR